MRIPLTKYGLPEVVTLPTALLAVMAAYLLLGAVFLPLPAVILPQVPLAGLLFVVLWFFRDPQRHVQAGDDILLAPADGRITDVELLQENEFIGAPALRIGIFLSIFDTHVNRAPCNVTVLKITYRQGKYKAACNPASACVNESNDLGLVRTDRPQDKLIVRQISGAIARRIVCKANVGQELAAGEKFGMIKFGSRTEVYVPIREDVKCLVRIGDKVKAGVTPLVKYVKQESCAKADF